MLYLLEGKGGEFFNDSVGALELAALESEHRGGAVEGAETLTVGVKGVVVKGDKLFC